MSLRRQRAMKRLKRDLLELERSELTSIAAKPLDSNFMEWHVNIKASEGMYSGIYLHLILDFPDEYPSTPPNVQICTPIDHPNVYGGWLCLSMLRPATGNVPYEGWSGAYSATSVLMQLQSFLFAENIDQDGGYQIKASSSRCSISRSIATCKSFQCTKCSHSHWTPWPEVKARAVLISVFPIAPELDLVDIDGTSCQTNLAPDARARSAVARGSAMSYDEYTRAMNGVHGVRGFPGEIGWDGVYGSFGCSVKRVFYEALVSWTGSGTGDADGVPVRIGFGSQNAGHCGSDTESFGYDGSARFLYNGRTVDFGERFEAKDTITAAIDFVEKRVFFAKNGQIVGAESGLSLPQSLRKGLVYPLCSFKDSRIEFNFGAPRKPCQWLLDRGFISLEQTAYDTRCLVKESASSVAEHGAVDWHSEGIIDELWLWVFECLRAPEVFAAKRVCRRWAALIAKYNVAERHEMGCYFNKSKLTESGCTEVLGIGLEIKPSASGFGVTVLSQMDILSKSAWSSGCRVGVWGERLTHFLPLVMNRRHGERAQDDIERFLKRITLEIERNSVISNPNELELEMARPGNLALRLVDSLIAMMNAIVVQFVMKNDDADTEALRDRNYYDAMGASKSVDMVMCEKVVLGYSALHHLLLWMVSRNKKRIQSFADRSVLLFLRGMASSGKWICKNIGKLLIYTMISTKFSWKDIGKTFMLESFTRNVKWLVKQPKYAQYDTTNYLPDRVRDTFQATQTSRRLIMFQVWFSRSNAAETLHSYNQRLGRPRSSVRHGVVTKTKEILRCCGWKQYFNELRVRIDVQDVDRLLRFAVFNSSKKGYHRNSRQFIGWMTPPKIGMIDPRNPHHRVPLEMANAAKPQRKGVIKSSPQKGNPWKARGAAARNAAVQRPQPGAQRPAQIPPQRQQRTIGSLQPRPDPLRLTQIPPQRQQRQPMQQQQQQRVMRQQPAARQQPVVGTRRAISSSPANGQCASKRPSTERVEARPRPSRQRLSAPPSASGAQPAAIRNVGSSPLTVPRPVAEPRGRALPMRRTATQPVPPTNAPQRASKAPSKNATNSSPAKMAPNRPPAPKQRVVANRPSRRRPPVPAPAKRCSRKPVKAQPESKSSQRPQKVPLHLMGGVPSVPVLRKAIRNDDDLSSIKRRLGVSSPSNGPALTHSKQAEFVQMVPFRALSGSIGYRRTIRLVGDVPAAPAADRWPSSVVPPTTTMAYPVLVSQPQSIWNVSAPTAGSWDYVGSDGIAGGIWSDGHFGSNRKEMAMAEEAVRDAISGDGNDLQSTVSAETPNEERIVNESEKPTPKRKRRQRRKRRKTRNE